MQAKRSGWIRMIGFREATGRLAEIYGVMRAGHGSRPGVYSPPTGDAANIVRCHSLDPEGLRLTFAMSGEVSWSALSLPWEDRELLNTVTSRANHCFY